MGLEKATEEADRLARQAFEELKIFGTKGRTLEALGRFVLDRKS
jgi:hypothetical protein